MLWQYACQFSRRPGDLRLRSASSKETSFYDFWKYPLLSFGSGSEICPLHVQASVKSAPGGCGSSSVTLSLQSRILCMRHEIDQKQQKLVWTGNKKTEKKCQKPDQHRFLLLLAKVTIDQLHWTIHPAGKDKSSPSQHHAWRTVSVRAFSQQQLARQQMCLEKN